MTIQLNQFTDDESTQPGRGFGALESAFGNLPLCQLSYHAHLVALAGRTTILQTFINPFDEPIEAKYLFPIEIGQAVVACEMRVGQRVIAADLKERGIAKAEYRSALASGHRAALLEENRPETFSMSVGNIAPGEAVQVCIQTVFQIAAVAGEWTLRLPLVVAPRYTSGIALPRPAVGPGTAPDTDQVPDASTVTPPTWLPGMNNPIDLRIVVDLELGQLPCSADWIEQLSSTLHAVAIKANRQQLGPDGQPSSCRVQVMPGERVNRDFILRGKLLCEQVTSSLVCEPAAALPGQDQRATFALTLVPPKVATSAPKDVMYVIDRSGSMEGWKMAAACKGVTQLLQHLHAGDRFQIVAFDDQLDVFQLAGPQREIVDWHEVTQESLGHAQYWLSRIHSRGGTELGIAFLHGFKSFADLEPAGPGRCRALVLITDGQVSGEDSILRAIESMRSECLPRIYCLGIDRAVNASVLKRIANRTSGTMELVESEARMNESLIRFGKEIGQPALTELSIQDRSGQTLDLSPLNCTTLYAGRTQMIYGRCAKPEQLALNVRGRLADGQLYDQWLSPTTVSNSGGSVLLPLWGKERLRGLEDQLFARGGRHQELEQDILACSLECRVLSRLTAFVAVDRSEKIHEPGPLHQVTVLSELPEGWALPLPQLDSHSLLPKPKRPRRNPREDADNCCECSHADGEFSDVVLDNDIDDSSADSIIACDEGGYDLEYRVVLGEVSHGATRYPTYRLSADPRAYAAAPSPNRRIDDQRRSRRVSNDSHRPSLPIRGQASPGQSEIERLVNSILETALLEHATHIYSVVQAGVLKIYLVIAGQAELNFVPRPEQAQQIIAELMRRALLVPGPQSQLISGQWMYASDGVEHPLQLHVTAENFMIEMPRAAKAARPACVEEWWKQNTPAPVA